MKEIFKKIRNTFSLLFVRRIYVITRIESGVKYYYTGKDSMWTPMFDGAKYYTHKPNFEWMGIDHIVEDYYE